MNLLCKKSAVLTSWLITGGGWASDSIPDQLESELLTPAQKQQIAQARLYEPEQPQSYEKAGVGNQTFDTSVESVDRGFAIGVVGDGNVKEVISEGKGSIAVGTTYGFKNEDYDIKADDITGESHVKKVKASNKGISIGVVKGTVTQKQKHED